MAKEPVYISRIYPEFIQLCTEFSALSIYKFLPSARRREKITWLGIVVYIESCVEHLNRVWGSPGTNSYKLNGRRGYENDKEREREIA